MSNRNKRSQKEKKSTVVIIDGDNFFKSLKHPLGVEVYDLIAVFKYIFGSVENLMKIVNFDKRAFGPIILLLSEKKNHKERKKQNIFLNSIEELAFGMIDIFIIDPKTVNGGSIVSNTDLDVGTFLTMALYDNCIENIVLVSGDGDFKRVLRWVGVPSRITISLVCIKGTDSSELKKKVLQSGGDTYIIGKDIIKKTNKDGVLTIKKGEIKGLRKIKYNKGE
ncbi:MAG: NYN domain-containing protein [Candidatus Pacebacteria bacterium]|nr:NYN domain-containing protein [Candidatus Paceibacterota bacterium]